MFHEAKMNSCPAQIWRPANGSSTVALKRHQTDLHGIDFTAVKVSDQPTSKNTKKKQSTLPTMLPLNGPLSQDQITKLVLFMLSESSLPLRTVKNRIFRVLVAPDIKRHLLSPAQYSSLLPQVIGDISAKIKKIVQVIFSSEITPGS